jgi:hypothetical protein
MAACASKHTPLTRSRNLLIKSSGRHSQGNALAQTQPKKTIRRAALHLPANVLFVFQATLAKLEAPVTIADILLGTAFEWKSFPPNLTNPIAAAIPVSVLLS